MSSPPPPEMPPYGAPVYGPPPPNYLVQAILTTLFCCLPFGVVSIVFAAQVNSKFTRGDLAGAADYSRRAKQWAWISFWSGLAVAVIYAIGVYGSR